MKVKCYSVRLKSMLSISEKAYLAVAFNGSKEVIPKSQCFGIDYDVQKSDAYWISAWILDKKDLQYSKKKSAWFDKDTNKMCADIVVKKNTRKKIVPKKSNIIKELRR